MKVLVILFLISISNYCHCVPTYDSSHEVDEVDNSDVSSLEGEVVYNYEEDDNTEDWIGTERIVTKGDQVQFGVEIDYRYNESAGVKDGLHSVFGCPKSVEGNPWVWYGNPTKCYFSGMPGGPCGYLNTLRVEPGSPYGICYCRCLEESEPVLDSRNKDDARFCPMIPETDVEPFVFVPALRNCYELYEQGPCETSEWLVRVDHEDGPPSARCEKRKCPEGAIPAPVSKWAQDEGYAPGSCFSPPQASLPGLLTRSECAAYGMKYSKLLERCIPIFKYSL